MSFTSALPANLPKFYGIAVKIARYTYVCNILLKYVDLGDIVDPANHRSVFDALTCVASRISKWSEEVEEFTWWIK